MKTVKVDNQLGSRSIQHRNLLAVSGVGVVQFEGLSIAPVARVLGEAYEANGKWSFTRWEVALSDGAELVSFYQDYGVGRYFPDHTWAGAIQRIRNLFSADMVLTDEMIINLIRSKFAPAAEKFDAEERQMGSPQFTDLVQAQADFAQAQCALNHRMAELQDLEDATNLRKRTADIYRALGNKSMSLVELQAFRDAQQS